MIYDIAFIMAFIMGYDVISCIMFYITGWWLGIPIESMENSWDSDLTSKNLMGITIGYMGSVYNTLRNLLRFGSFFTGMIFESGEFRRHRVRLK